MMTEELKLRITTEINEYADIALKEIDREKMPIGEQLALLNPKFEELAARNNIDISEIFVIYMDSSATFINNIVRNMDNYGNESDMDDFLSEEE